MGDRILTEDVTFAPVLGKILIEGQERCVVLDDLARAVKSVPQRQERPWNSGVGIADNSVVSQ
jgi:hypothetical protein